MPLKVGYLLILEHLPWGIMGAYQLSGYPNLLFVEKVSLPMGDLGDAISFCTSPSFFMFQLTWTTIALVRLYCPGPGKL